MTVTHVNQPTPTYLDIAETVLSPKLQRLALVNVCLGQFMSALDSRSVIVALPTISIYFNSSMALNASLDGQPLYEAMGYAVTPSPMMFLPIVRV